jgi:hypothetical protein
MAGSKCVEAELEKIKKETPCAMKSVSISNNSRLTTSHQSRRRRGAYRYVLSYALGAQHQHVNCSVLCLRPLLWARTLDWIDERHVLSQPCTVKAFLWL